MALKHHVAFTVPLERDVSRLIVDHFCDLGYRLVDEADGAWRFQRGNKLSVLWRFDIRAYDTDLLVRTDIQPDGQTWVSCDFEVWTFLTIVIQADIVTLDAEARELESVLRHAARRRHDHHPDPDADTNPEPQPADRPPSTDVRRLEDRIQ
jgi:hypothetical protein